MKLIFTLLFVLALKIVIAQGELINKSTYKKAISTLKSLEKSSTINDQKLTAYVFLSPECPLSKYYIPQLNLLYETNKDIMIIGIVPGRSYDKSVVATFIKKNNIRFPIYIDVQKKLSTFLNATVTPESVVVGKGPQIFYRGAIDDRIEKLGEKKMVIKEEYLKNALNDILNNHPVKSSRTEPIGCYINDI